MYNYCKEDEYCGQCMGQTIDESLKCMYNLPQFNQVPLIETNSSYNYYSDELINSDVNEKSQNSVIILILIIIIFIIILFFIVYYFYNKK